MSPVIDFEELRTSPTTLLMEGHAYGAGVSFFLIEYPPGRGNSLHRHPYDETWSSSKATSPSTPATSGLLPSPATS